MDDITKQYSTESECSIENEGVVTTYHEKKIGKTLYRVTSVYLGKIDFQQAIEDYTVRKVLSAINDPNFNELSK